MHSFLIIRLVNLNNFVHIEYLVQCELTVSVIAITLSKISFGLTLLRLTDGWARRFVYFAIATLAIFATPACVILWLQCQSSVSIPGRCLGKRVSVTYGQFQGSEYRTLETMYMDSLSNSKCSMVCDYGCVSRPVALENYMEPPDEAR
jgi:hypothetical protein